MNALRSTTGIVVSGRKGWPAVLKMRTIIFFLQLRPPFFILILMMVSEVLLFLKSLKTIPFSGIGEMSNIPENKISVFDYTDYRKYLADYYKLQKARNPAFSYRYFARRAKISSPGFYKELVDGKRSLSRSLILKFSDAIKLSRKEAEYFENMVYFSEAVTVEERKLYFNKMMSCYESKAYRLLGEQYEYFSRWYYIVIREIISFVRFKDDYRTLARLLDPPIREDQAKKAIYILERLRLIEKDGDGFYRRTSSIVTTGYPAQDTRVNLLNVINFQKEMLKMAGEAYDRHPLKKTDMSTLTLSISEQTFLSMKEEIAGFRKKLLSMAEKDEKPDRVYQLCHHFYPVAKDKGV